MSRNIRDNLQGYVFVKDKDKRDFIKDTLDLLVEDGDKDGYVLVDGSTVVMDDFRCFHNYNIKGTSSYATEDLSVEYRDSIVKSIEKSGSEEKLYSYIHKALGVISEERCYYREKAYNEVDAERQACFDHIDEIKAQECSFTSKFYEQVFDK